MLLAAARSVLRSSRGVPGVPGVVASLTQRSTQNAAMLDSAQNNSRDFTPKNVAVACFVLYREIRGRT